MSGGPAGMESPRYKRTFFLGDHYGGEPWRDIRRS